MKQVIGWVVAIAVVVSGFVASAQSPPAQATPNPSVASAEKAPVLTDVEKLTLTNKIQAAQLAGQQATPKALSEAIAQLIEQRQQAASVAATDASQYYNGLAKDGYALNVQTMTYEKKVDPKK